MKFEKLVEQLLNEDHFKVGDHVTYKGKTAKVVKQVGEDGKPHVYLIMWEEGGKKQFRKVAPEALELVAHNTPKSKKVTLDIDGTERSYDDEKYGDDIRDALRDGARYAGYRRPTGSRDYKCTILLPNGKQMRIAKEDVSWYEKNYPGTKVVQDY